MQIKLHEKPTNTIKLEKGTWESRGSDGRSPFLLGGPENSNHEVLMVMMILLPSRYFSDNLFFIINNFYIRHLYLYLRMILVFLVNIPIFIIHLWLPRAHEVPVRGSIILAGILLKLGVYGLLRVYIILKRIRAKMNFIWFSIRTLVRLICWRQTDLKSLTAYSSVVTNVTESFKIKIAT